MDAIYFPVIPAFYNPYGVPAPTTSNAVLYNGTNHTPGSGTATYTLSTGMTVSVIESNVWLEFGVTRVLITTNATNIAENTAAIAAIVSALADLETSGIIYDGTTLSQLGLGSGDHPLNNVWTALNVALATINATISGISTGVTQTLLNTTINTFVSPFTNGLTNPSNTLLVATIGSGDAIINGQYQLYGGGTVNLINTRDNYIYLTIGSPGTLTQLNVAISGGAPSTPANSILLWKLTTDGTHVVGSVDLRNTTPFTVSQLKDLYANNSIPFAARNISEWADFLLPVTASLGKVLQSDGSDWIEGVLLTIDETNHRLGLSQTTPLTTLDLTTGTIRLGDDGTNLANSIKAATGRLWFRNASAFVALASQMSELSDVTLAGQATNDVLVASSSSAWINKPNGTVPTAVVTTALALYPIPTTATKVVANNAANTVNLQLPSAASVAGQTFDLCASSDGGIHAVTISSVAGLIRGVATLTINAVGMAAHLWSDGTNYWGTFV